MDIVLPIPFYQVSVHGFIIIIILKAQYIACVALVHVMVPCHGSVVSLERSWSLMSFVANPFQVFFWSTSEKSVNCVHICNSFHPITHLHRVNVSKPSQSTSFHH